MNKCKKIIGIVIFLIIISSISIQEIKADTTFAWTSKESRIFYDNNGTENVYNWHTIPYTHTTTYPITQMEYRLKYSGGLSAGNTYTFQVSYTPDPDAIYPTGLWFSDGTNLETIVNCSGWSRNSSGKYSNTCNLTPVADISSSGYLYVRIVYQEAYLTSLKSEVGNFTITKGTGAIIQDSAVDIMENNNNNTNAIIDNQTNNANDIMSNANTNRQYIINNQNSNTTSIVNGIVNGANATMQSQRICDIIGRDKAKIRYKYLNENGEEVDSVAWYISEYINVYKGWLEKLSQSGTNPSICFYNKNKTKISCSKNSTIAIGNITLPTDTYYIRYSGNYADNEPQYKLCKDGNQSMNDTLNQEHEYNNNASETINGQSDLDNMRNTESQILDNLDLSGASNLDITINPNASSWIWEIVEMLRGIGSKITLLFSSVLGLGIIKMILNR